MAITEGPVSDAGQRGRECDGGETTIVVVARNVEHFGSNCLHPRRDDDAIDIRQIARYTGDNLALNYQSR